MRCVAEAHAAQPPIRVCASRIRRLKCWRRRARSALLSRPWGACASDASTSGGQHGNRNQRSSGRRPVRFPTRTSMWGPSSSSSWKANTKSDQPSRESVRCEPDWRLSLHPSRSRAAQTRRALADGQMLTRQGTRRSGTRRVLQRGRGVRQAPGVRVPGRGR
jgi:hypothetical protein